MKDSTWLRSSDTLRAAEPSRIDSSQQEHLRVAKSKDKGGEPCECYLQQGVENPMLGGDEFQEGIKPTRKNLQTLGAKTTGPEMQMDVKQGQDGPAEKGGLKQESR